MIWLAFAVAVAPPAGHKPADWNCAEPLVRKNYQQRIDSRQLALRIADECARPFMHSEPGASRSDVLRRLEEAVYEGELNLFIGEIQSAINKRRRADTIPLKR